MEPGNTEQIKKKIDEVNDKIWRFRGVSINSFDQMSEGFEIFELAKTINYKPGIAKSMLSLGMGSFIIKQEFDTAMSYMNNALAIFRELNDKKWIANTLLTMGIVHNTSGNKEAAMYNALRGFDYFEADTEPKDFHDTIMAHYILGTIYKDLKKMEEAESYFLKGISLSGLNDNTWGGRIYAGLSSIYTEQGKYEEALKMSHKGLDILKAEKNRLGESRVLTEIGLIYKKQKEYKNALACFFEGMAIREENNTRQFVLGSLIEIADVYKITGECEKAIDFLKRAEVIAREIGQTQRLGNVLREIGSIYKTMGNFEEALAYYEKFLTMTVELNRKETEAKISSLQNDLIKEKEKEIERLRNVELKQAYDLISEKNKEITDSIQYARRIQRALLASDSLLSSNLKEHFVMYRPKDIVSGDFYWAAEKENCFYLAVCDSTGHGVPGAFMSLLNSSFLNEAINEKNISEPHLIFNHIRERLIGHISQDGSQDGMDGILLCIDRASGKLSYCAANNTPVSIRNGVMTEHSADKMPVGKGENISSFTKGEIDLKPGDLLYLFTDGYSDQFGGEKGKKMKQKGLTSFLQSVSDRPIREQADLLEKNFQDWKGKLEQIDDVLVLGIRF